MANPAFRLLHITDTHLFEDTEGRLRGVDTRRTLSRVLARAQADARPVGAVLATGDLSQDETPAAYQHFRTLLVAARRARVVPARQSRCAARDDRDPGGAAFPPWRHDGGRATGA